MGRARRQAGKTALHSSRKLCPEHDSLETKQRNATSALFIEVIWRKLWQRRGQEAATLSADATRNQWAEKLRILRGTRRVLNPNGKMLSPWRRGRGRVVVGDQSGL